MLWRSIIKDSDATERAEVELAEFAKKKSFPIVIGDQLTYEGLELDRRVTWRLRSWFIVWSKLGLDLHVLEMTDNKLALSDSKWTTFWKLKVVDLTEKDFSIMTVKATREEKSLENNTFRTYRVLESF